MKVFNPLSLSLLAVGFSTSAFSQSTWTESFLPVKSLMVDVIWADNQLMTVGDSGHIFTSPDGEAWTKWTSGMTDRLSHVLWNGKELRAAGSDGSLYQGADGIAWNKRPTGRTFVLTAIAWTGTKLVAVGSGGRILTADQDAISIRPCAARKSNALSGPLVASRMDAGSFGIDEGASQGAVFTVLGSAIAAPGISLP